MGRAERRRGSFSFLPQLVTQGSSVHGLSNKLAVELKHTCLHFSSLNFPSLLLGVEDFGSNKKWTRANEPSCLELRSFGEHVGVPPAPSYTSLPGDSVTVLIRLIRVIILLATSDQVPGTVPGPYVCISFNLNTVREMLVYD